MAAEQWLFQDYEAVESEMLDFELGGSPLRKS
jgi:hypothetical protein